MSSYLALGGNEVVNAARLAAYVDHGLIPSGFSIRCKGCAGLEDILPCDSSVSPVPVGGYFLPDQDHAPWYDANRPESKNFAGLLVTSVTMSAPYSRNIVDNIGDGMSIGRLRLKGRQIVVHGYLIGKTCCATTYGLQWLTAVLGDSPCGDGGADCGGSDLDFLSCSPNMNGEDACITDVNGQPFIREAGSTEFQRASDFFRRMQGVGVIDGPNVISCKGNSCGCGCGSLLEVEFTLQSESPYLYSVGEVLLNQGSLATCDSASCDVNWVVCADGESSPWCPHPASSCADDPLYPLPALPPVPASSVPQGPGGVPLQSDRLCIAVNSVRAWGDSTLNIDIFAGSIKAMRNITIQIYNNPTGLLCSDASFDDCTPCSTVTVSYVPLGGTLHFSGEDRTVTVECNGISQTAFQSVSSPSGAEFAWPDLSCNNACICITSDCNNVGADATVTVTRVNRDL